MDKHLLNAATTNKTPVVISARGKVLGRLATEVATTLRGKDSPHFKAHLLSGRPVTVTHAKDVLVTGNKLNNKMYYRHTGYIGNLYQESLRKRMETHPERAIHHAVRGMLPNNRLRKHWLANLEIRVGD